MTVRWPLGKQHLRVAIHGRASCPTVFSYGLGSTIRRLVLVAAAISVTRTLGEVALFQWRDKETQFGTGACSFATPTICPFETIRTCSSIQVAVVNIKQETMLFRSCLRHPGTLPTPGFQRWEARISRQRLVPTKRRCHDDASSSTSSNRNDSYDNSNSNDSDQQ